jgi:hypothetical protein
MTPVSDRSLDGEWFLPRVAAWTVLVCACALPFVIVLWPRTTLWERLGEAGGVLVWIVVMVNAGQGLRAGALGIAILHAILAVVLEPWDLFVWFAPAVWVVTKASLISSELPNAWNFLVLTVLCGVQTAGCTWLSSRAIDVGRRVITRRPR